MSRQKKLGYMFYPQNWKTDLSVLRLTLEQRAVYRELIDDAYLMNNKVEVETSLWARLWGVEKSKVDDILEQLKLSGLVVLKGKYLSVPSCNERLGIINRNRQNGKLGGVQKSQSVTQSVTQTEPKRKGKRKEKEIEKEKKVKESRIFTPPTSDEVAAYCTDRQNSVDPDKFVDFYSSKGWFVGKNKMKDWKSAVRTWERSNTPITPTKRSPLNTKGLPEIESGKMTRDELMNL